MILLSFYKSSFLVEIENNAMFMKNVMLTKYI